MKTCEKCRVTSKDVKVYWGWISQFQAPDVLWSSYHLCNTCKQEMRWVEDDE